MSGDGLVGPMRPPWWARAARSKRQGIKNRETRCPSRVNETASDDQSHCYSAVPKTARLGCCAPLGTPRLVVLNREIVYVEAVMFARFTGLVVVKPSRNLSIASASSGREKKKPCPTSTFSA